MTRAETLRIELLEKALLVERFLRTGKSNRAHRHGFGTIGGRYNQRVGRQEEALAELYEARLGELGFTYGEDP